jgi:hypothetical protein
MILICSHIGNFMDRVHEIVDHNSRCPWWELAMSWEKGGGLRGILTEGFGGRFDGEARPAAVKGERQW